MALLVQREWHPPIPPLAAVQLSFSFELTTWCFCPPRRSLCGRSYCVCSGPLDVPVLEVIPAEGMNGVANEVNCCKSKEPLYNVAKVVDEHPVKSHRACSQKAVCLKCSAVCLEILNF